ncbi:unnamed protein product [Vicia faba]|uniref:Uncharacterized protein n=1 Tax=Vicia faba TaxID=3906 RepID=A0AAV1B4D2_VICFA|nr:unnamed protein product [Vicia faba]
MSLVRKNSDPVRMMATRMSAKTLMTFLKQKRIIQKKMEVDITTNDVLTDVNYNSGDRLETEAPTHNDVEQDVLDIDVSPKEVGDREDGMHDVNEKSL